MNAKTIGYWASTGLLAVAAAGSGIGKLTRQQPLQDSFDSLGYPHYMLTILGTWYVLAAIALLIPGMPRLKEWAYAGLTFAFSGALASHIVMADGEFAPVIVLLVLTGASWALRPESRRL
ncbi:MAG: putative membrane protein YphA (DoxX/SURF4 family) [Myxococcota bacterium]|jgi:uncharacterized membrane protein YphA (DoxX/SURF4 family)